MTVKNREPQDKVLHAKGCCFYCYYGDFAKAGHRRVRRAWKSTLRREVKRDG